MRFWAAVGLLPANTEEEDLMYSVLKKWNDWVHSSNICGYAIDLDILLTSYNSQQSELGETELNYVHHISVLLFFTLDHIYTLYSVLRIPSKYEILDVNSVTCTI